MGKLVHMKRNFQKIYCLCDMLTECPVYVKKHFTQIDDIGLSFKQVPHFDSWHLFLCVCVFYVITNRVKENSLKYRKLILIYH